MRRRIDGIVVFSQTDFAEDLKQITVPVLVMHGDDDQIVPYADSAPFKSLETTSHFGLRRASAMPKYNNMFWGNESD